MIAKRIMGFVAAGALALTIGIGTSAVYANEVKDIDLDSEDQQVLAAEFSKDFDQLASDAGLSAEEKAKLDEAYAKIDLLDDEFIAYLDGLQGEVDESEIDAKQAELDKKVDEILASVKDINDKIDNLLEKELMLGVQE